MFHYPCVFSEIGFQQNSCLVIQESQVAVGQQLLLLKFLDNNALIYPDEALLLSTIVRLDVVLARGQLFVGWPTVFFLHCWPVVP